MDAFLIISLDHMRHQPITGSIGEVIIDQWIALDIDLGCQLAMIRGADEEMDVRRPLAMPTKRRQQPFRRTAGRHPITAGKNALKLVAAIVVGDDGAAHVERRLFASRIEMRVEAAGVAVPHFDFGARLRLLVRIVYHAMHDQRLAVGVAAIIKPRKADRFRGTGNVKRPFDRSGRLVIDT